MEKKIKSSCVSKVKFAVLLLLFMLFIFVSAYTYSNAVSGEIAKSVFRLHVIANSDTEIDQSLKYMVRDNVLEYINTISENITDKNEVVALATENNAAILEIAQSTIKENGFDYPVAINIGNFAFPTKEYGDVTLPAGFYDALRIEIGEAKGQNWWCVMFPPLCFVDVSEGIVPEESKKTIEDNVSEEEYAIITDDSSPDIKFKFKILELLQDIKLLIAKGE